MPTFVAFDGELDGGDVEQKSAPTFVPFTGQLDAPKNARVEDTAFDAMGNPTGGAPIDQSADGVSVGKKPYQSVLKDVVLPPGKTGNLPVRPEVRDAINAEFDSGDLQKRESLQAQRGVAGLIAGARAKQFNAFDDRTQDAPAKSVQKRIDSRAERRQEPVPMDPDAAENEKSNYGGLVTGSQLFKDLKGGIEQTKGLGVGAATFASALSYNASAKTLADLDALDAGKQPYATVDGTVDMRGKKVPGQPNALVQDYRIAKPEDRTRIRETIVREMLSNQDFIADSVKLMDTYKAEQKKLSGKIPDFTDIETPTGFANWLVRTGVSAAPTMAAAMAMAAVGGVPGMLAGGGAMATGDMTQERAGYISQRTDPAQFKNPDRRDAATAAQPRRIAEYLGENAPATAGLAVPYAALDYLGPVGAMARGVKKEIADKTVGQVLKSGAKALPGQMGEEFINESGQGAVNIAASIIAKERSGELTAEDAKSLFNQGMAGVAMAPGGHAINVAKEAWNVRGAPPIVATHWGPATPDIADIDKAPDIDSAISAAVASVINAGQAWQNLGITDPLNDLDTQRAVGQAGAAWQSIAERNQRASEEAGAAASRATDARLAQVGQAWQDLGITTPAEDLARQRTWNPNGSDEGPGAPPAGPSGPTDGGAPQAPVTPSNPIIAEAANVSNTDATGGLAAGTGGPASADQPKSQQPAVRVPDDAGRGTAGTAQAPEVVSGTGVSVRDGGERTDAVTPAAGTAVAKTGDLTVEYGGKRYAVKSIEDAQAKWEYFREQAAKEGGGARDIGNGVQVRDGGTVIGRISYNGRFHPAEAQDRPAAAQGQSFPHTLNADGTVKVMGDPAAIRAVFPGGVASKDGVTYGKSKAPAVVAALTQPAAPAYDGPLHLGRNGKPVHEGGKPFRTKDEAKTELKNHGGMRVMKAPDGKGFVLADLTPRQLAARQKAARRMGLAKTSPPGEPIPVHAYIAAEGGLSPTERSEMGIEGNVRIGNRWLFAGAGRGMTIEQATERLMEEGYLADDDHNAARALIKASLTNPKYTPDGYERLAEAEAETKFEDHLAAQHDEPQDNDPFSEDDGFATVEDLPGTGYERASEGLRAEVRALIAMAEAQDIDTDALMGDIGQQHETESEFYAAAKDALEATLARGDQDSRTDSGEESDARASGREGEDAGLTAPTREDVTRQQDRADNAEELDQRAQIDREAELQTLTSQTAPEQRQDTTGDLMGGPSAEDVLADRERQRAASVKTNDDGGTTPMFSRSSAGPGNATVRQLGDKWVVVTKPGTGGESHHGYYASESEARAAAAERNESARLHTTRARGDNSRWWIESPTEPIQSAGNRRLDSVGRDRAVRQTLDAQANSISSADEAEGLQQIPDRAGWCFPSAAEAAAAGVGDMVIGVAHDPQGNVVWHAVVMRDGMVYDPTFGRWFEPGVYEALGFKPKATLTGEQVQDFIQKTAGSAPDAKNQGLGKPQFSRAKDQPWYYSQLARAIDAVPERLATQPAAQWRLWLDANAAKMGVKKDEIEWSGVKDWLALRGKDKVSKQEIADYLKAGGVKVEETMLGEGRVKSFEEWVADNGYGPGAIAEFGGTLRRSYEAFKNSESQKDGGTKYSNYTLPGGENYRELLITLPPAERKPLFVVTNRKLKTNLHKAETREAAQQWIDEHQGVPAARGAEVIERDGGQPVAAEYRSSHWDQPNILAHIRFDERTDAEGRRVLMIQEIQSDWGQAGKKEGFDNESRFEALLAQRDAAPDDSPEQERLQRQIDDMGRKGGKGVPSAPFVTDTKAWTALAIKRMIAYAAENGFDKIAFVNGEQSADRYDLSKQIKSFRYEPTADGKYEIGAEDINGRNVLDEDEVTLDRIEELVGKDIAKKVEAREGRKDKDGYRDWHYLEGLDLKVGGEGMKAFYDQIVPQVANEVLKKLGGGKMGVTELETDGTGKYQIWLPDIEGFHNRSFASYAGAVAFAKEIGGEVREIKNTTRQQSFTITPEMRAKAAEGLPLFKRGQTDPALTMKVQAIERHVERVTKGWKNAPEVIVVTDMEDPRVPQRVREEDESQKSQGATGEPEGFFYDGKVYIVADGVHSAADVARVIAHETLGHYGLRGLFGKSLDGVLDKVTLIRRAEVAAKAEEYGLDMSKREDRRTAAEEVLTNLAETQPDLPIIKRLLADIRTWLRENVPYFKDLKITDAELIRDFILPARDFVTRGREAEQGGAVPAFSRNGVDGDTEESLLRASYERIAGKFPDIADYQYDFSRERFVSKSQGIDGGPEFDAADLARQAREAGVPAGAATIKRAILSGTILRGEGVSQAGLEGVRHAVLGGTDGILYSRSKIVSRTTRQHTPDQLQAMRNVGFEVQEPTMQERLQAFWKDFGKKMTQGIVDQFAPVKDLSKDAYTLMRLSKGASGAFDVFMNGGQLRLTDKVYDFDPTKAGGVTDRLLIPLQGEHQDFMRWVAANRAERLAGQGKENLFTPQDIAALKTLSQGATDFDYTLQHGPNAGTVTRSRPVIYKDALATFNEFHKNALDMAEQSGLIDPASRKLWEQEFYVPFYRVADDKDGGFRGVNIKGGVIRQQAFKALKGGTDVLNSDLLDNTLMNWAHLIDAAAKNRAAKATIEVAVQLGAATPAQAGEKNSVWYMDNGQKVHAVVDDPYLLTAISALEYAGMRNGIMDVLSSFKHMLTVGVTASPFFKVRNLIRDSVQAVATGNLSYNVAGNVAKGWALTKPQSEEYFRLMAGGGTIHFGTMLEGSEAKRQQALIESGVDDATLLTDMGKVKRFYRRAIEPAITAYNELGSRGEAINRASLYDQLRKQGLNHADASLQARDLMDFSMQGSFTTIRFLTQVVPFFNARAQGLYKLGRAAKEDPARFSIVVGAVALMSLSLLAMYHDDPDWKRREEWDRNNYWWFKFGGKAYRIPKPFEVGAIGTLAERSAERIFDKEMTGKRFREQILTLLGDNLSMNPVPQAIKPIMDVYANKDSFTGRPIESMSQERLKSEYRFNDRTTMTARGISTAANAVTGLVGKEALSPIQVDHLIRGYFGWLGAFVVGSGDLIARWATDQPKQAAPDYWKVATGGMIADLKGAQSRYVSQMYEQAKEIEQAYGTYRQLLKEGKTAEAKEFYAENKGDITKYRNVEAIKKAEGRLNERVKMIERSNMSADQKRELITAIQVQKEQVARQLR